MARHHPYIPRIYLKGVKPSPIKLGTGLQAAPEVRRHLGSLISVEGQPLPPTGRGNPDSWVRRRKEAQSMAVPCGPIQYPVDATFRRATRSQLQEVVQVVLMSLVPSLNKYQHQIALVDVKLVLNPWASTGVTHHHDGGACQIQINVALIRGWTDFVDTLLHELAHVLRGFHDCHVGNHCYGWQATFAWLCRLASTFECRRLKRICGADFRLVE